MPNYLAILVAAVAGMIVGALWYSPLLFGNVWMKLMGLGRKQLQAAKKKGMGKSYFLSFVALLVMAYVISRLG